MKVGVWLIGARGSIATTVVAGAAAVKSGLSPAVGCVTELPFFASCALPGIGDLVFGGHDITATPLAKRAERFFREALEAIRRGDISARDFVTEEIRLADLPQAFARMKSRSGEIKLAVRP